MQKLEHFVLGAILYTEVGTFVFGTYCGISRRGMASKIRNMHTS